MDYMTFEKIHDVLNKHTGAFVIGNDVDTLSLCAIAYISDTEKEVILMDLDKILPMGLVFSHEYENGKLKILFKEFDSYEKNF